MSTTAEEFVSACLDELQISQRFAPYVRRAEDAGFPHLSRVFRALVACETTREALFRKALPHHAAEACDFFVCPHCGLIYDTECPEQCPVDQTPAADFIVIV